MRRSALAAANGDSGWRSRALRARGDNCVTCAGGIPGCWLPLESAPQPASTASTARTKPRDRTVRKALRRTCDYMDYAVRVARTPTGGRMARVDEPEFRNDLKREAPELLGGENVPQ